MKMSIDKIAPFNNPAQHANTVAIFWRRLLPWISIFFGLALAGCQSIKGFPEAPIQYTEPMTVDKVKYYLGPTAVATYNHTSNLDNRMLIRNEIIDARMAEIDKNFSDFQRSIYRENIAGGVATDWALLALGAAGTVSTVEATKTALAAISTAVIGGAASFDKRALFEKTLPALLSQMTAQRETVRASIRTSQQLPATLYTLSAAESQLEQFAFAGSIPGAIAGVTEEAGKKTSVAVEKQKQLVDDLTRLVYAKTKTTKLLSDFWRPDGKINPSNSAALTAWMSENGLPTNDAGHIPAFLNGTIPGVNFLLLENLRSKAVVHFKLE